MWSAEGLWLEEGVSLVLSAGALLLLIGMIPAAWLVTCYVAAAYDQLSSQS